MKIATYNVNGITARLPSTVSDTNHHRQFAAMTDLVTSEAMVAEIPEKKPAPAMPSGNGMDF